MSRSVAFFVPGDLQTLTGGYGYDREIIGGLRTLGWRVDVEPLSGSFPEPTSDALDDAARRLAGASSIVVVDGLALPGLAPLLQAERRRSITIGLVHHPVALEPDLLPGAAQAMREREIESLAALDRVVCTSRWTANILNDFGVTADRIDVVEPGTYAGALAQGSTTDSPNLLCVATITSRKGHALLLSALSSLRDRPWHLHLAGSLTRDAAYAAGIERQIAALGLAARVTLHGELVREDVARLYEEADLFVLASRLEGYGMVLSEALAHGLPIVATAGGAVPYTVPADAALLVPPDDEFALRAALEEWLCAKDTRAALRAGAVAARTRRRDWHNAAREFADVLSACA
jgi:glycosyltransferase involved in cell wall biosynthesis